MLALWLLAGCAEPAILEVSLALPAEAPACGASLVRVEARFLDPAEPGCPNDAVEWAGDALDVALEPAPATVIVDVVAEGDDIDRALCLRVLACDAPGCPTFDPLVDPSTVAELARPFHRGERSRWAMAVADPCALADLGVVDACAVAGCTDEVLADYCVDGAHLCDR